MAEAFIQVWRLNSSDIREEFFKRSRDAELNREKENIAAIKMQKVWKSYVARTWIKQMSWYAIKIQKVFRGFLGRRRFKLHVIERNLSRRMSLYNKHAIAIQRVWKGYFSRKYRSDYFARKAYLANIQIKMENTRRELAEYEEVHTALMKTLEQDNMQLQVEKIAESHHVCLTEENLKKNPTLDQWFAESTKKSKHPHKRPTSPKPQDEESTKKMAQGPFLPKYRLDKKRYRHLNPTLRVQTDFYDTKNFKSEEKRVERYMRVSDAPIKVSRYIHYSHPDYFREGEPYSSIKRCFRESNPENQISKQNFRHILPPIDLFDK